ncbi:MAG: DUF4136 domain-containing protein [Oleispira sp.]|nr:DUF4136 domain-containing protein [Oleispira sp.]
MKSNKILASGIVITAMLTAACTQVQTKPVASDNLNTYSAIVTADESFHPKANDTFVWYDELVLADENDTVQSPKKTKRFVEKLIEDEVRLKHYQFTDKASQANYMIGAAVILDNSEMSQKISNFVEIFPSLRQSINQYNEGTLLVVIARPGDMSKSKILWRGAIQAYVAGEEMSLEQRQLRTQAFIKQLMNSLPTGK